jgi:hypothetical protein
MRKIIEYGFVVTPCQLKMAAGIGWPPYRALFSIKKSNLYKEKYE